MRLRADFRFSKAEDGVGCLDLGGFSMLGLAHLTWEFSKRYPNRNGNLAKGSPLRGAERKLALTDRIRFITHHSKQILLVDLSNCSGAEVERIVRAVPELVTTRPRDSVLILSDFTGASFNEDALRAMKEAAVFDKPYVKKSAWVGAEDFPKVISESMKSFSRREFPSFETREEALTWLVKE